MSVLKQQGYELMGNVSDIRLMDGEEVAQAIKHAPKHVICVTNEIPASFPQRVQSAAQSLAAANHSVIKLCHD